MIIQNLNELVRYCYECGMIGEVPDNCRDCCPDGMHAAKIPLGAALQARNWFKLMIADVLEREKIIITEDLSREKLRAAATEIQPKSV